MPCGVSTTFNIGRLASVTLTCTNSGANTHDGLHTSTGNLLGMNKTWAWKAPATGQTAANTSTVPVFHKTAIVGEAD